MAAWLHAAWLHGINARAPGSRWCVGCDLLLFKTDGLCGGRGFLRGLLFSGVIGVSDLVIDGGNNCANDGADPENPVISPNTGAIAVEDVDEGATEGRSGVVKMGMVHGEGEEVTHAAEEFSKVAVSLARVEDDGYEDKGDEDLSEDSLASLGTAG